MNESLLKFKESLVQSGMFKRTPTNHEQYRGRLCPRCGDTKYHCYVKISLSTDDPPLWHCFKCNESGVVNKQFLAAYQLDIQLPKDVKYHKRIESNEYASIKLNQASCNENDDVSGVVQYINDRIGVNVTFEELQQFRYVGNPRGYVAEFFGRNEVQPNVLQNRYWFQLNNGNIIGRYNNDNTEYRWIRYPTKHVRGRGIYTMRCGVDTHEPINIVIAEGIMDVIGLYYHYPMQNALYIATLGSDYKSGITHILKTGIFGNSVMIHIFKDSDVDNRFIKIDNSTQRLFKHIYLYQNMIDKDYGVTIDKMDIQRIYKFT